MVGLPENIVKAEVVIGIAVVAPAGAGEMKLDSVGVLSLFVVLVTGNRGPVARMEGVPGTEVTEKHIVH